MKFLTDFTYRNLHGFARFPGGSTTLVFKALVITLFDQVLAYQHHDYFMRLESDGGGCSVR